MPLEDYLGETKVIIDQIVDQAANGLEVLRGNSSYIYDGNWKMQMENGCDGYHVSTVHWNYAATMDRRKVDGTKAVDANSWSKSVAGVYGFDHGHILLWTKTMNPEVRPVYQYREEIKARVGEVKADFIVNQTRNLCLYPNVFLMDQFSTQIRVVRPISVDKTEVSIFCFAPKGESATDRATRIRQYEDFFNVSGMGTADDLEEFRACQAGYAGTTALWNDLSRGAPLWVDGPDANAKTMGLKPRYLRRAQRRRRPVCVSARILGARDARRAEKGTSGGAGMSFDYQKICAALYREARLLDDRQWDEWLACYAEDVTYWMPAWDDDDQLTDDHESQISLMYYPDRGGLEDRVFRIKTERSGASMPEPRTSHNVTNVEVLAEREQRSGRALQLQHAQPPLQNHRPVFRHDVRHACERSTMHLLISYKRIVLKNDYIRQVLDIYHV